MALFGFDGENAREKLVVLLTMCFALAMAMLDNTVVNVALPTISDDLGAGVSELQWIVDGYVLAFASLLLTGGILGDRYGRKRTFLGGLLVFTAASLASGLAGSTGELIAFRALQGIGAALLLPGTLSILTVTFPPHERARAIGLWAGMSGLALALGPTLGGLMVERLGWQSVFFLNVPIGAVALLVATRTVRESVSEVERRLDLPGLLLGTVALFSATYGLIEANRLGWSDPLIVGSLLTSGPFLAGFLGWELRNPHPMMPLGFFRIPAFSAGNAVAFSVSLGMFATFFFLSLYMQLIHGYTAFQAGLRFLPMTLAIVATAPYAGRFAQRNGSRGPMTYGLLLAGAGLLFLGTRLQPDTSSLTMLPVFVIMGHGMGSTMAPMTAAVMNAVGPQRAGLGSAMTNTSREIGGVLGIALLGTILTTRLRDALLPALAGLELDGPQREGIAAAAGHGVLDPSMLAGLSRPQILAVREAFAASFMAGFHTALLVGGTVLLLAAWVAYRFIPGRGQGEARPAAEAERIPVEV
ncbi:MAG TPA: DHA2 family efflux MFS transporter permease subunit [Actinomycetota bacterium]|nr:DHA2 family efflux MFS transporter permease subunit [Actinomycetota bacterium]